MQKNQKFFNNFVKKFAKKIENLFTIIVIMPLPKPKIFLQILFIVPPPQTKILVAALTSEILDTACACVPLSRSKKLISDNIL